MGNSGEINEITPAAALKILQMQMQVLDSCAAEIEMDRPDVASRWRKEAQDLRDLLGG